MILVLKPTRQHNHRGSALCMALATFLSLIPLSYTYNERNLQLNATKHGSANLFKLLFSNTHGETRQKIKKIYKKRKHIEESNNTASGRRDMNTGASASSNLRGTERNQGSLNPYKFSSDGEQSPKRGLNVNEGETRRQMSNSCLRVGIMAVFPFFFLSFFSF